MTTLYLRPNLTGDETSIGNQYPASTYHWDKVDEATTDEDTTYVYETGLSYLRDLYKLKSTLYLTGDAFTDFLCPEPWMRGSPFYANGKAYIAYSAGVGADLNKIKIFTYDYSTKVISSPVVVDTRPNNIDYASPSLAVDVSGYIHVFWAAGSTGTHGGQVYHRVSTNPYDISAWSEGNVPAGMNKNTHPNLLVDSSGYLYFISVYFNTDTHTVLIIRKSTDGGVNWTNPISGDLVDFATNKLLWPNCCWVGTDNKIHIAFNQSDLDEYLYDVFYIVGSTEGTIWKKADGTPITTPAMASTADQVFDSSSGQQTRAGDIGLAPSSNYPYILMARRGTTYMEWQLAKWNGSSWAIKPIGTENSGDANEAWGILDVIDTNSVVAYLDYGSVGSVKKWITIDGGDNWSNTQTWSSVFDARGINAVTNAPNDGFKFLAGFGYKPRFFGNYFSYAGTINWIKVWIRCRSYTSGARTAIKTGGVVYDGEEIALPDAWTDYSTQYTTNPQAGGPWTWVQLNSLQAGVSLKYYGRCTQVYIEVDYVGPEVYEVECSDGFKVGDTNKASLTLNLSLTDGLKAGDNLGSKLSAQVLATDGLKVGDSSVIGGTFNVILQDGFLMGDICQWAQNIYECLAEDGFKVGDTTLVNCILQVLASDGLKMGDSTLAQKILNLILSDGMKLGDLPKGQIVTSLFLTDGMKLGDAVVITVPGIALKDAMVKPTRKPRIWIYIG